MARPVQVYHKISLSTVAQIVKQLSKDNFITYYIRKAPFTILFV